MMGFTRKIAKRTSTSGSASTIPLDEDGGTAAPAEAAEDLNLKDLAMKGKALTWKLLKKGSYKSDAPMTPKEDEEINPDVKTEVPVEAEPEAENHNNEAVEDKAEATDDNGDTTEPAEVSAEVEEKVELKVEENKLKDLAIMGKTLTWKLLRKGSSKSDAPETQKEGEKANPEVAGEAEAEAENGNSEAIGEESAPADDNEGTPDHVKESVEIEVEAKTEEKKTKDFATMGKALTWKLLRKGSSKSDTPATPKEGEIETVNEAADEAEAEAQIDTDGAVQDEAGDAPPNEVIDDMLTDEPESLAIDEETAVDLNKSKKTFSMSMLSRTTLLLRRNSKTDGDELPATMEVPASPDIDDLPTQEKYEGVYIVLQPIEFKKAIGINKMLREFRDQAELEHYILMQHWSIQVGDKFYHLHKNDDETLAISLVPVEKMTHTVKIPIWRTNLTHEARVGMGIGVIKEMGNCKRDEDVKVYEASEDAALSEDERIARQYSSKTFRKLVVPMTIGKGKYNPVINNCITFALRFLFGQLFRLRWNIRTGSLKQTLLWVIEKWRENGVRHNSEQIFNKLTELFSPMKVLRSMKLLQKVIAETTREKLTEKVKKEKEKAKEKKTAKELKKAEKEEKAEKEVKEKKVKEKKVKIKEIKVKEKKPKKKNKGKKPGYHPLVVLLLFYLGMDEEEDDGSMRKAAEEAGETIVEETEGGVEVKNEEGEGVVGEDKGEEEQGEGGEDEEVEEGVESEEIQGEEEGEEIDVEKEELDVDDEKDEEEGEDDEEDEEDEGDEENEEDEDEEIPDGLFEDDEVGVTVLVN